MPLKSRLREILEDPSTVWGYRVALVVQLLIFASIVVFTVQTIPELSPSLRETLAATEFVLVAFFTVEYAMRAWVANPTRSYVVSFYGLVDLISIVPFFLGLTGMQTFRALRVFRLARILKLTRYSQSLQRLSRAVLVVREELIMFGVAAIVVMYLAAVGIYMFENEAQPEIFRSIPHSFWWSIVTLTTVGYGDAYPITLCGRIFTGLVLMTALGIVAIPSAIVASSLTEIRRLEHEQKRQQRQADDSRRD